MNILLKCLFTTGISLAGVSAYAITADQLNMKVYNNTGADVQVGVETINGGSINCSNGNQCPLLLTPQDFQVVPNQQDPSVAEVTWPMFSLTYNNNQQAWQTRTQVNNSPSITNLTLVYELYAPANASDCKWDNFTAPNGVIVCYKIQDYQ